MLSVALRRMALALLASCTVSSTALAQSKPRAEYLGDNSQLIAPATGMPALTVPMGFTYGTLPAGLQILARPYDELLLFRLAYAYEQGTHHRRPPEGFPKL